MKILYKDIEGLQIPKQAHPDEDAAHDIFAASDARFSGEHIVRPGDGVKMWKGVVFIEYLTNLCIAPQDVTVYPSDAKDGESYNVSRVKYHTHIYPRSSISKYNLVLANSVATIDSGYRDQILLRFKYMWQPEDFVLVGEAGGNRIYGVVNTALIYQKGDRIGQLEAEANLPIEWVGVEILAEAKRGTGKFGSSGA